MTNPKELSDARMESRNEVFSFHACLTGDCPHNHTDECFAEMFDQGYLRAQELHEAETKMLVEALQRVRYLVVGHAGNKNILDEIDPCLENYRSRGTKET